MRGSSAATLDSRYRSVLLHIRADGSLPSFDPPPSPGGRVYFTPITSMETESIVK
jgi:hypothetical protein